MKNETVSRLVKRARNMWHAFIQLDGEDKKEFYAATVAYMNAARIVKGDVIASSNLHFTAKRHLARFNP